MSWIPGGGLHAVWGLGRGSARCVGPRHAEFSSYHGGRGEGGIRNGRGLEWQKSAQQKCATLRRGIGRSVAIRQVSLLALLVRTFPRVPNVLQEIRETLQKPPKEHQQRSKGP